MQHRPFSHFYSMMARDAMRADVIFVIGSGLSDLHLNTWLAEARCRTPKPALLFVDYWRNGYILQIPVELEEAARIDGASELDIFVKVILPMLTPGLITVGLITGLNVWNEFLIAITFLQDAGAATATVRFNQMGSRYASDVPQQMATATMIAIPTVVFFLVLQRRFIEGISSGALKG